MRRVTDYRVLSNIILSKLEDDVRFLLTHGSDSEWYELVGGVAVVADTSNNKTFYQAVIKVKK